MQESDNDDRAARPDTVRMSRGSVWRSALLGMLAGFVLTVLAIVLAVFGLGLRIDLRTGIHALDSLLYSLGSPVAVVLAALVRGVSGGAAGSVLAVCLHLLRSMRSR